MLAELLTVRVGLIKKAPRIGPAYFTCVVFLLTLCNEEFENTPSDSELARWYKDFNGLILAPVDQFLSMISGDKVPTTEEIETLQRNIDNYTKTWNKCKYPDRERKVNGNIKLDKAKKLNEVKRELEKCKEGKLDVRLVYYRPKANTPRELDVIHMPPVMVKNNARLDAILFLLRNEFDTLFGINIYSAEGFLNEYASLTTIKQLPLTHQIIDRCQFHLLGDRKFMIELNVKSSQNYPEIIRNIYETNNGNGTYIAKNASGSLHVLPDISGKLAKGSHTWWILNSKKGRSVEDIFNLWDVGMKSMGIEDDIVKISDVEPPRTNNIITFPEVPRPPQNFYLSPGKCNSSMTVVEEPVPNPPFPEPIAMPSTDQIQLNEGSTNINESSYLTRHDTPPMSFPQSISMLEPSASTLPHSAHHTEPTSPFTKPISYPPPVINYSPNHAEQAEDSMNVDAQPSLTMRCAADQNPHSNTIHAPSFVLSISKPEPGPSTLQRPTQQPKDLTNLNIKVDATKRDATRRSQVLNPTKPSSFAPSSSNLASAQITSRNLVRKSNESANINKNSSDTKSQAQSSIPTPRHPAQPTNYSAKPNPPITPLAPQLKPEKEEEPGFMARVWTGFKRRVVGVVSNKS